MKITQFQVLYFGICLIGFLWFAQSCSLDTPVGTEPDFSWRGEILSAQELHTYSIEQTDSVLNSFDPDLLTYPNNYPISIYRIVYKTVDWNNKETYASGAVVIPTGVTAGSPFCVYTHGTVVERYDVPGYESDEIVLGILYAADGFVSVLPDYLGLGDSPGRHPYCHAATEATATIDLMRAAKYLCDSLVVALNGQTFIFGYSQGGHAAMATTKAIQESYSNEFTVTASAPMSGPYDLSGVQTDLVLSDDPYGAPFYLPYLMFGYNEVYDMYPDPADYLLPPYDTLLPPLFDGTHSGWEIDNVMPAVPKEIIRPEVLTDFITNPENPFRLALQDNDLTGWVPEMPLIMYYCSGDELVTYENSIVAHEIFQASGSVSTALYQPSPSASHGECAEPCFIFANIWFSTLRN